jgi:hypothetical protein
MSTWIDLLEHGRVADGYGFSKGVKYQGLVVMAGERTTIYMYHRAKLQELSGGNVL